MKISAKAEYACLAVIELARPGMDRSPKRVREIASAQGIPAPYLIQILLRLKAAGLVQSARGSVGGYQLARSPSDISVGEVIAAIDGKYEHIIKRESVAARNLAALLSEAQAVEQAVLTSATIAQVAAQVRLHDPTLGEETGFGETNLIEMVGKLPGEEPGSTI
jgi:Rrf2 family protein